MAVIVRVLGTFRICQTDPVPVIDPALETGPTRATDPVVEIVPTAEGHPQATWATSSASIDRFAQAADRPHFLQVQAIAPAVVPDPVVDRALVIGRALPTDPVQEIAQGQATARASPIAPERAVARTSTIDRVGPTTG